MNTNRRKFLTSTGALTASAAAGSMLRWGVESAEAQALGNYKALVCVFLFGGSDSNNMIVPVTDYSQYAATRNLASNVAITQAELLPFAAASAPGKTYGFHPSFAPLTPTYTSGNLAVIANAGTLLAPLTKADYQSGINRPQNLFSHSDQQNAWMGQLPGATVATGWAGRSADTPSLVAANLGSNIPVTISVSGKQLFTIGKQTSPLVIPQNGGVSVSGQFGTDSARALHRVASTAANQQHQYRDHQCVVRHDPGVCLPMPRSTRSWRLRRLPRPSKSRTRSRSAENCSRPASRNS